MISHACRALAFLQWLHQYAQYRVQSLFSILLLALVYTVKLERSMAKAASARQRGRPQSLWSQPCENRTGPTTEANIIVTATRSVVCFYVCLSITVCLLSLVMVTAQSARIISTGNICCCYENNKILPIALHHYLMLSFLNADVTLLQ